MSLQLLLEAKPNSLSASSSIEAPKSASPESSTNSLASHEKTLFCAGMQSTYKVQKNFEKGSEACNWKRRFLS